MAAVSSAHAVLLHSLQAGSLDSQWVGWQPFVPHTVSSWLPFLQASLLLWALWRGHKRTLLGRARGLACYPCNPQSPQILLRRHCLGSFICHSYPFRDGWAEVSVWVKRTLRNGVILISQIGRDINAIVNSRPLLRGWTECSVSVYGALQFHQYWCLMPLILTLIIAMN